jgi:hypothetical protein
VLSGPLDSMHSHLRLFSCRHQSCLASQSVVIVQCMRRHKYDENSPHMLFTPSPSSHSSRATTLRKGCLISVPSRTESCPSRIEKIRLSRLLYARYLEKHPTVLSTMDISFDPLCFALTAVGMVTRVIKFFIDRAESRRQSCDAVSCAFIPTPAQA